MSIKNLSLFATALLTACTAAPTAPKVGANAAAALPLTCDLKPATRGFEGTCSVPCSVNALAVNFIGIEPARACSGPNRVVAASLERTSVPNRWLGTMQGVQPEDPTRLEVVPNKVGAGSVARMPYGWFEVKELTQDAQTLRLVLEAGKQVRPNSDDLAIIDRAIALLPSDALWNKDDNRQCPPGQNKLSLFCALMQATTEISGGVHYRQPAMQATREELNKVDPARIKTHRIMDYNNHPATTLAEVHELLRRAKARVSAEIR